MRLSDIDNTLCLLRNPSCIAVGFSTFELLMFDDLYTSIKQNRCNAAEPEKPFYKSSSHEMKGFCCAYIDWNLKILC